MTLNFSKFHGAGNDFILVDNRDKESNLNQEQIQFLCHRRLGIGADGLILLESPKTTSSLFSMKYFNADGLEGTMCGNGGRCITAFAKHLGFSERSFVFDAIDGIHQSNILSCSNESFYDVTLKMKRVEKITEIEEDYFLDTGSPHLVVFVDNAKNADVVGMGKMLRNHSRFAPGGTNVNFVSFSKGKLFVRTYERGVEDETLSCGTGITASALAIAKKLALPLEQIEVATLGGNFSVTFKQDGTIFDDIWLQGPVKFVFQGTVIV